MAMENSKLSEKLGKSHNKAANTEMTFMTGQGGQENDRSTNTERIYQRILGERNEESVQKKLKAQKAMPSDAYQVSQYQNQSHSNTVTEEQFLVDKRIPASDVMPEGETSMEEDEDARGLNIDEFFVEEQKEEKLEASDGKILFRYSSKFVKHWSNMVIILAMYNSVTIPISIFYDVHGPSFMGSNQIALIDALVDLIFLIDVILTFRTTYLDTDKGKEETDTHKIALTYLRGSFTIDFASSVPFAVFVPSSQPGLQSAFNMLGLLKLLRIQRLSAAVQGSNLPQGTKVYLKILMMAFQLLVVMHVLATIWFSLVISSERWVQNMDFMYVQQEDAYQGFFQGDENFLRKHLVMMYTAFYIFTVGEIVPRATTSEFAISFFLESICTIVNAVIIGFMTAYMDELNKKSAELSTKINLTNTAMINLGLTRQLKTEISKYIYNTHTTLNLQNEMNGFLDQIKLSLRQKVTKTSFVGLVQTNYVMRRLLKQRTDHIFALSLNLKTTMKDARLKFQDKLITILISEFTNVFTEPDGEFMIQDDDPTADCQRRDDKGDDEDKPESFMYFIRNGQFEVKIKSVNNEQTGTDGPKEFKKYLYDGDHFGEIGLIFETSRTATVISRNYGSMAKLTYKGFKNIERQFPMLTTSFKEFCFKYKDDLRTFLEMECEKIKYFSALSNITKQELLYSMERKTYRAGTKIFKEKQTIDRLILIQSGIVELSVTYDKRRKYESFIIERLTTGAILNHQAFIVKDTSDTYFVCRTPVSCFELSYDRMKKVMEKRADLKQARNDIKQQVFKANHEIALDYIFHNTSDTPQEYAITQTKNELRVKFKNAVMQVWTQVKKEIQPKDMSTLIAELIANKNNKALMLGMNKKNDAGDELTEDQQLDQESKTSYFTLHQYQTLKKRIDDSHFRMKQQQELVDSMDKKVHDNIVRIRERRRNKGAGSALSQQF